MDAVHHIAIVGSGPAGCYLADALARKLPAASIDVFERLPTPFGLIRGGVAPDHPGTKAIVRQFERTFARPAVRFFGNVEIGRDLSHDELAANHHAVIYATGALEDRRLGIPGEDLDGICGSGAFVGWYNGIPDHRDLAPRLDGRSLAIIGNGNVALDIARLLAKTPEELANSDLCVHARTAFAAAPLTDLWIIGRRSAAEASFSTAELAELGTLSRLSIVIEAGQLDDEWPDNMEAERRRIAEKNLDVLRSYAMTPDAGRPLRLHLIFKARPLAFVGTDRVAALRVATPAGEREIAADTVVTAIGYRSRPLPGLPFDNPRGIVANSDGRVAPGVYASGWCRRGPQGVVPANRADALEVADLVAADLAANSSSRPGRSAIDALLAERRIRVIDFAGWQRINAAEVAAGAGRPREKLTRIDELLAAANIFD